MNGLRLVAVGLCFGVTLPANAQAPPVLLLKPARVFDGEAAEPHENWVVLVRDERIERAGPADQIEVPADARVVALCRLHGVRELWTADRDFSRFPGLTVRNPLID